MSNKITRREMIQKTLGGLGAGFGVAGMGAALTACGGGADTEQISSVRAQFLHGVASGDPMADRVIIWTRISPEDNSARLEVAWEVASDAEFKNIVSKGMLQTSSAADFTVKADAGGLMPGQQYFYRFKYADQISATGQTKTLPSDTSSVSFAVCSCANYPAGYFYVYREIAQQNVDAVLHLGDYIYEYGEGGYATEDADKLGRNFAADNAKEILTLSDYRKRYALYRMDADLQAAHQRHPFIVIWDDHELSNDAWLEGAENHQADEGSFAERKAAALQAYFEWMPIRAKSETDHLHIYRQFNYGNLVQLNMLDTRILSRSKQLDYADFMQADGSLNAAAFSVALQDSSRTLMGQEQLIWLANSLGASKAKWNVLGQQVLMAKMLIPAEILSILAKVQSGSAGAADLLAMKQLIAELSAIKLKQLQAPSTLTAQEKARISAVAPYNLDAWDGYAYEREALYTVLRQSGKQAVVLAGDTHNAWQSALYDMTGHQAGVELAASSVTSPGIEQYLQISEADMQNFRQAFTLLIDELQYCNLNLRGYLKVSFDSQHMQSQWIFVNTVKDKAYRVDSTAGYQLEFDRTLQILKAVQQTA